MVSWASFSMIAPWRFHSLLKEIKSLAPVIQVVFKHVRRSANGLVDILVKRGMDRLFPLFPFFFVIYFCVDGIMLFFFYAFLTLSFDWHLLCFGFLIINEIFCYR